MSQNLISGTMSAEDVTACVDAINVLKEKMPFLSTIQNVDVSTLFKPGNNYQPLLSIAKRVVETHPEILPAVFNKDEFLKDHELYKTTSGIALQVAELDTALQKTVMAVGSDALIGALEVYAAVKQHKNKVAGLSAVHDEMKQFFNRSKTKAADNPAQ